MNIPELLSAEEGLNCHTYSAEDSDSNPKLFFYRPPTHYICQSSWTDVSKRQRGSLGVESVTVTASHPADCSLCVCACMHWNWQLQCVGASLRAPRWMGRWVITHGPQHHTGIITGVNNTEHIRGLVLRGRLTSCDCNHGGLIHVCKFSCVVMWGVQGVRKL